MRKVEKIPIPCQSCGEIRMIDKYKFTFDQYIKRSPLCRKCSANTKEFKDKVSKGWFKKGHIINLGIERPYFVPWNKGIKGLHFSPETEFKKGQIKEELNNKWKGDNVGYHGLHTWVQRNKGKAEICEFCDSMINVQWANKSREYKRKLDDWLSLCNLCHRKYDKEGGWGKAVNKFPELKKLRKRKKDE